MLRLDQVHVIRLELTRSRRRYLGKKEEIPQMPRTHRERRRRIIGLAMAAAIAVRFSGPGPLRQR
jgi:hypothetical protein